MIATADLPDTYFMSAAVFFTLLAYGVSKFRQAWALPYIAVLCTIAAWYFIEPLYFQEFFWETDQRYIGEAYGAVLIFYISFAIVTPGLVKKIHPQTEKHVSQSNLPAEKVLKILTVTWLLLLTYGTVRMNGDLFSALFPLSARTGINMWSRGAGAGAGAEGFIVSTASYLYVLCLAAFGVLIFMLRRGPLLALACVLILISWPYAFLQGSRNIALAVVMPGLISFLLFSNRPIAIKGISAVGALLALNLIFKIMIQYRNIGFNDVNVGDVQETQHLGLNMASELLYCVKYINEGILDLTYGARYVAELVNVIPRAIWPDKPFIGIEYTLARGFSSNDTDIGVFATISTGVIGQGVLNFGTIFGPVAAATLMGLWVSILSRFRAQGTPSRNFLFLVGLGLTFNLGRDITLLVLWPIVFGYIGVRIVEARSQVHRLTPAPDKTRHVAR